MKIQLTIAANYVSNWGAYEGIREMIQNGRDAEVEHNAPLTVSHKGNVLSIVNEGSTLPIKALLMGESTKVNRDDLAGQFGEGLKLGLLALVRAGHKVTIRNGSEVWTPALEHSNQFGCDVLTFDIQKGRAAKARVAVEIHGITAEDWAAMRPMFRFLLTEAERGEELKTYPGKILIDRPGAIYTKGIFVCHVQDYALGYDFENLKLDRDRKMADPWDLEWRAKDVRNQALSAGDKQILKRAVNALIDGGDVPKDLRVGQYDTVPEALTDAVTEAFTAAHGADAVPVESLAQSRDLEHLGRKGVVVSSSLRQSLRNFETFEQAQSKASSQPLKVYGWHELSETEKANLERAIRMVAAHAPVELDQVTIADLRDTKTMGLYHPNDRKITLAKRIMENRAAVLETLIHEVAHMAGGDGDHGHVAEMERIWSAIVEATCPA